MLQIKQERGVTLIELMFVVIILGILFTVGANVLISGWRFMFLSQARWEIQRDVRTNLDLVHRNLREAEYTSVTIYKSTDTAGVTNPPCSKISFTNVDDDEISYYQDGDKLYQKIKRSGETTYATTKLAENLRYIYFAYPKSDERSIISLSICFEKETFGGGAKALQLSVEKIRLMNE
ncbi:MAG TPA: hypothetical protein DHV62_05245 [Elusimicrobia bacterium]|jgi:prepilin-type N-terminal cleavage/methylation domain-containing protein|nr:hypothetical protein [Elusimicrobiota bacterium]